MFELAILRTVAVISEAGVRLYKTFRGDIDGFARGGSVGDKEAVTDEQWSMIDDVLGRMVIGLRDLSSSDFDERTSSMLRDHFTDGARFLMANMAKAKA